MKEKEEECVSVSVRRSGGPKNGSVACINPPHRHLQTTKHAPTQTQT